MDAVPAESTPSKSSQARDQLGCALKDVQAAAQLVRAAQDALKTWMDSLGDFVPKETVCTESGDLAAAYSKAAEDLHRAIDVFRSAWDTALSSVKDSTGILFESLPIAGISLKKLASGHLEKQGRCLKEALVACQTWDALKAEALAEDIELTPMPADMALDGIPEAVATRQIETRQILEHLAAPRILQNSLAEILAGESPPTTLDGLLSSADWETILEATSQDTKHWGLYGLALRSCASSKPERLIVEVRKLIARAGIDQGPYRLKVLSFLSREQFVFLYSRLPEHEEELQAVLVAALLCSERSDYWFWEPLEAFTRQAHQTASKWQTLLHHLAQATIARGGFETLRDLADQALKSPPQVISNPRQALQALQDHLHEPINCSERSRFRLRHCAYQQLLADLRAAVRARDVPRAKQEFDRLSQADLDDCYDRYAAEINLTTRSLRDHFKEDIREVLQLTATWLSTGDSPAAFSQKFRLQAAISDCTQSPPSTLATADPADRASVALGRCLRAWCQHANQYLASADFPPETPTVFEQPLPKTLTVLPTEWRSFGAQVERGEPSWADWSLDQMDSWVGYSTPKIALHRYLRNGHLEAARQAQEVFANTSFALDSELVQEIKSRIDTRRADLAEERNALLSELSRLRPEDQQRLENDLCTLPDSLTATSIKAFEEGLAGTRRRLSEALAGYQDEEHRKELTAKLLALGRIPATSAPIEELERDWAIAWETTAPQRSHIGPIRRFQALARDLQLNEIGDAAERALMSLEAIQHWSTLQNAGDAELYFDALFTDALGPLLRQAHNWLPEKRAELLILTLSWLEALGDPTWLQDTQSSRWRALSQTAELKALQTTQALAILQEFGIPLSTAYAPQSTVTPPPTPDASASPETTAQRPEPQSPLSLPQLSLDSGPLVELRVALDGSLPPARQTPLAPSELRRAFEHMEWKLAAEMAGSEYRRLDEGGIANGKYALELLVDFAAATILVAPEETQLGLDVTATLLHAVNRFREVATRLNSQAERTLEQLFLVCFAQAWASEFKLAEKNTDKLLALFRSHARELITDPLPAHLVEWLQHVFSPCSPDSKQACPMVDTAWSKLPRDSKDTPIRGWLVWTCLQTANWPAMQRLLIRSNPEAITPDQAHYFQLLADEREVNWQRFESFVTELRLRSRERPAFLNFTERLLQARQSAKPPPVKVQLMGMLQQQRDGGGWIGQIQIEPPQIDPPATLTLTLPETADIRFAPGGSPSKSIEGGPFLSPAQIYCDFSLRTEGVREQRLQVRCTGKTLSDNTFDLVQEWQVRLRKEFFEPPNADQISAIFRDFSPNPVQGEDYVDRPWDQREIQRILFPALKPGSLWLRAPRRSGKTSMLLRQMQAFCCRADRPTESGIVHIEVNRWNHCDKSLGKHIWEQLWSGTRNRPFARVFGPEAEEKSRPLTGENDVGIFLQELADFLIASSPVPLKRVYYFLDEADNLRGMHYSPDPSVQERCRSLLWQLRGLVQATGNVGVLFSTATAADRIFAERPESPFYNSIPRYTLQPFSTDTQEMEDASRAILQPEPLRQQFELLPPETVSHILRITRGIPYYMKSVAGAAYASARSRYISRSDVNRATELLLHKKIGSVARELESPGMDELSVLDGGGSPERRVLAKGVMLAAANLLSGFDHPYLLRADLMREDGPLKKETRLEERRIREGLDSLLELGFLATPPEKPLHLHFSIPILGESLRAEFRKLWNDLVHQLEEIAASDSRVPLQPTPAHARPQSGEAGSLRSEVEKYLHETILAYEYQGREFFVSSAGAFLQSRFPGGPLHERLGYPKLVDLLLSIEGIKLEGVAPRLTLRSAPTADLRPRVVSAILELVDGWEQSGRHMTAAVLGNQLLKRFPGMPPHQRLGFQSLAGLLYSINEITVLGVGLHKTIHRARPETLASHSSP